MSSEISIDGAAKAASRTDRATPPDDRDALQPWQLFTLAGLAGATAVVFVSKETGPAGVILLSITIGAAAWMGLAAWRTLAPLFGLQVTSTTEVLGGRTRAALERDKALVLRALRDLEFDRAMKKVSEKDFVDMNARLRSRAAGILKQLDRGAGYRDEIERELEKRIGGAGTRVPQAATKVAAYEDTRAAYEDKNAATHEKAFVGPNFSSGTGRTCTCGAANDADARFCKACGSRLEA